MPEPVNIDVVMTTLNEEVNLPHALASVRGWAGQVFVVDSGSTDRTVQIAQAAGAHVHHQDWLGYAGQKNWCLDNLPLQADWVFLLDADESIQPDLKRELERVAAKPVREVPQAAFNVNRYFIFLGKRIRHCDYYPSWNIRFFKRGEARYEQRDVHEHMIAQGPVGYLPGHMEHYDRRGVSFWNHKHNQYAVAEAREVYKLRQRTSTAGEKVRLFGSRAQRRRWIKHHLYPHLPAKWLCRFAWNYIIKLGFLDGVTGLRFCLFITAYEVMIDLNLKEYERGLHPEQQAASGQASAT